MKERGKSTDRGKSAASRRRLALAEPLERRVMLLATVEGVPPWAEQGPGPLTGGQVRGIDGNNAVTGAVNVLATHPTQAGTIWAGTVGGGIWKTSDGGINWYPKTDQFPSLAITALAVDPGSDSVVWAGTGRASSSSLGGRTIGLLKSGDGGETWANFPSVFASRDRTVHAIVPTTIPQGAGRVVLVGSDATATFPGAPDDQLGGGLLRSTDGGFGKFAKISGNHTDGVDNDGDQQVDEADENTGLPAGTVTDIKADPGNPNRFYAAVAREGVFLTDNGGSTWRPLNDALAAVGANLYAVKIGLSVSGATAGSGNRPIYAAMIVRVENSLQEDGLVGATKVLVPDNTLIQVGDEVSFVDSDGKTIESHKVAANVPALASNRELTLVEGLFHRIPAGTLLRQGGERISGVYRSDNMGASWQPLGRPGDADGGSNASYRHFSMLADWTRPNVVYVGGSIQPLPSNIAGAIDHTGRILEGTYNSGSGTTAWSPATDNGANQTGPHADSRAMVYVADGDGDNDILQADDGGVYRLENPRSASRRWRSANGNLRLTEFYSVAWDASTGRILGGTQDIGVAFQSASGSPVWNTLRKGDGAVVHTAPNPGNPDTVFYSGEMFWDFTVGPSTPALLVAGSRTSLLAPRLNLRAFDGATIQFVQPYAVNPSDSGRILIGTSHLYESDNGGAVLNPLGGTPVLGKNPNGSATTVPNPSAFVGSVRAIVYGGRVGTELKPDVGWVGTEGDAKGNTLFVREGLRLGPFVPVESWTKGVAGGRAPGTKVVSIATDPEDWRKVYVLDAVGRIWFSDGPAVKPGKPAEWQWQDLTDQTNHLAGLPGTRDLQKIVVHRDGATRVLLLGGEGGLFRRVDTAGVPGRWHEYGGGPTVAGVPLPGGGGLPNAIVTDIDLTPNNLILVGTLGRGAFTATAADLATPGRVFVSGGNGNDVIKLRRDPQRPWLLNVYEYPSGTTQEPAPVLVVPLASIDTISLNGGGGNDQIVIDYANGPVSVPGGIDVNGGTGADTLSFVTPAAGNIRGASRKSSVEGVKTTFELTSTDPFGHRGTQTVRWTTATIETPPAPSVLASAVDVIGSGLGGASDALQHGLSHVLAGRSLAGLDARSLGAGLSGVKIKRPRPKDDPIVSVTSVAPDEETAQLDNATSVLRRLIEEGLNGFSLSDVDSAGAIADPAALRDALDALDSTPGNVTLDTSTDVDGDGAADTTFALRVQNRRLGGIVNLDVDVAGAAGEVRLRGALGLDVRVDLDVTFGADAAGFFLRPSAAGAPAIRLSDFRINGAVSGSGRFGFLGVTVDAATLSVDPSAGVEFAFRDPGTDAADGAIRLGELAPTRFSDLISVAIDGDPGDGAGNEDVLLGGTFSASAVLPGSSSGIPLFDARVQLRWDDLADPASLSVSATAGSSGQKVLDFLKLTGPQVLGQLRDLRGQFDRVSGGPLGVDVPLLRDALDSVVDVVDAFDRRIVNPLSSDGGGATAKFTTIQDLVATLSSELGIPADTLAYDPATGALTYRVELDHSFTGGGALDLDFGLQDGLSFDTSALAAADGRLDLDFTLGWDVRAIAAGSPISDNVFVKDVTFGAGVGLDVSDLDAAATLGFLGLQVNAGTVHLDAAINLTLNNPDNDTGGRITLNELRNTALSSLVGFTRAGSLSAVLPVAASLGGLALPGDARITLTDPALFDATPSVLTFTGLDDARGFGNITKQDVLAALDLLCAFLDTLRDSPVFGQRVPFTSQTIGDVLDLKTAFVQKFRGGMADEGGDPVFNSAQKFADKVTEVLGLPPGTITPAYDAATKFLTYRIQFTSSLAPLIVPLAVSSDLGALAVVNASSTIALDGAATFGFTLGMDLAPHTVTMTASADAPANGRLSSAASFTLKVGAKAPVNVTVPADASNASIDNLVADVNAALTAAGLGTSVVAGRSGNKLTLSTRTGVVRPALALRASAGDTAVTQLKFVDNTLVQDAVGDRFTVSGASVNGAVSASASDIELGARLGFIDVGINDGTAGLTATAAVQLRSPNGAAGSRVKIPLLASAFLSNPASVVVGPTVGGSASMHLPLLVEAGVLSLPGLPAVDVAWTDITDPGTLVVTFNADSGPLLDFQNLTLTDVLNALRAVANYLSTLEQFSFLDDKLPLLNKSVSELLAYAADFSAKVDAFQRDPAASLQQVAQKIERAFGLPSGSVVLAVDGKALKLGLDLSKNVSASRNVDLDLAALVEQLRQRDPANPVLAYLEGVSNLVDVSGSAALAFQAGAALNLDVGIDFTNPASPQPFLYDTTGLTLDARASATGMNFTAAAGPLGVFIRNGSAVLDRDGDVATNDRAAFTVGFRTPGRHTFANALADTQVVLVGQVDATLPMFFPTTGNPIGDLRLKITSLADIPGTITLAAPDLKSQAAGFNILNNLGVLIDGIDRVLAAVQAGLNSRVFSNRLPLVGDGMSRGGQFVQELRSRVVAKLHEHLDGAADKTVALAQQALFDALGPGAGGLGMLADRNGDGSVTRDDVRTVFTDTDGNGVTDQVQFDLKLHQAFRVINTPLGFDLGLPKLGLSVDGEVRAELSFDYALSFGVNANPAIGFYVDTAAANELDVRLKATVPGLHASGRLGPLTLNVTDSAADPSSFDAAFTVDFKDPGQGTGQPDNRLTFNEVAADVDVARLIDAKLTADADVNLPLIIGFNHSASFPSFAADFALDWHFAPTDPTFGGGDLPTVAFNNVRMNLGDFLGDFVGPLLAKMNKMVEPLKPVIDFLTAPLPVVSDLMGGPTSILDLARSIHASPLFAQVAPVDVRFLDAAVGILELIDELPDLGSLTYIPFGSFDLFGTDVRGAGDLASATPRTTSTQNPKQAIEASPAGGFFRKMENVGGSESSLKFPILDRPGDAFKLLLGQNVDLFKYDMAPLSLGFEYHYSYGPIPLGSLPVAVMIRFNGEMKAFVNLSFGFDTRGLLTYKDTRNPADIFGGFYLGHTPGTPELGIEGKIDIGADAGVAVAGVGSSGGVRATISASLKDPDHDGKVYLDEFMETIEHGLLCSFDVDGKITAGATVYVIIGYPPLDLRHDWKIAERTLVDWSMSHDDCFSTRFEDNDTRARATDVGVGPGIHLTSVAVSDPDDHDWYKFEVVRPTDLIDVETVFKNVRGNLDLDVTDSRGRLLGRSTTAKDREIVHLTNVRPGTYYVHVYGHQPDPQPNNYQLYIDPGEGSSTRVFYVGNATPATQYYTQGEGDDANDGTRFDRPKATLASLLAQHTLGPNDLVLFDSGNYAGSALITADDAGAAYAGSPQGSRLVGGGGGPGGGARVAINDSDGSLVYRLVFAGTGGTGIEIRGDGVNDAADNVVRNVTFAGMGMTGISIASNQPNLVQGNSFTSGATGISLAPRAVATVRDNDIAGQGIGIFLQSTGAPIYGNRIHNNGVGAAVDGAGVFGVADPLAQPRNDLYDNTTGVSLYSTADGAVVRFNTIRGGLVGVTSASANPNIFGNDIYGNATGMSGTGTLGPADWTYPNDIHDNTTGVSASASTQRATTVVRFNRIHHNQTGVSAGDGAQVRNNVIYRNAAQGVLASGVGPQVVNNTIFAPAGDGVRVGGGVSNVLLRNNIIWTQAGYAVYVPLNSQAGFDSDYNNLFTSGAGKIGWWQKDFTDLYGWMVEVDSDNHSIGYTPLDPTLDDPRFVNLAGNDYHLAHVTSTSIDSGDPAGAFGLEPAPHGGRVDLGAYGNTAQASRSPAGYVRVDSPNFYEDWEADQGHTIKWHSFNVAGNVMIELYLANGTKVAVIATVAAAQQTFQWTPRDNGIVGDSAKRYRVRVSSGATFGQTREPFAVPVAGGAFYVNDGSTSGDEYTPAPGSLRNTGKTPSDPKTLLVGLIRDYDMGPGDTVHVDTGYYLHVRNIAISGNVLINDDEGLTITGPTNAARAATLDRGGVPGNQYALHLDDGDFVTLSHLTLTGSRIGLWVHNGSTNFTGSHLTLRNNTGDGLRLEGDAADSSIDAITSFANGGFGIYASVALPSVSNGLVYDNGATGIELWNPGAVLVQRNEVYGNAAGITVGNGLAGTALVGGTDLAAGLGNKVYENLGGGITASYNVVVAGNTVYGHSRANQFGISYSNGTRVLNNVVYDNYDGIAGAYNGSVVSGNRIYHNTRYGLLNFGGDVPFTNNVVYSNGVGIYVHYYSGTIANNLVYANATYGIHVVTSGGAHVRNNTVYQEAGDAVRAEGSSHTLTFRNNVLWATAGHALYFAKDSQGGIASDYNLLYATGSGKVAFWQNAARATLTAWRNASFTDAHSLSADPLFVSRAGADGRLGYVSPGSDGRDDDFHERSRTGSFHGGSLAPVLNRSTGLPSFPAAVLTPDAADSPAIDRGSPADPFAAEPVPHGSFVNLGAYGNTAQASQSVVPFLLVTNPDGGEALPAGQTFVIEWRSDSDTGTVDVELLHAGGGAVVALIGDDVPNTGRFAWTVPTSIPAASDYVVRVTRNDGLGRSDRSDNPFAVVPAITVYYVNDGAFEAGDWTTAAGDDANDGLSPATPKATVRALLQTYDLGPGDVIRVDAGTYLLGVNTVVTAGDAGVTVRGYYDPASPQRAALFDRGNVNGASFAFEIQGANDVTLDRLWVTGGYRGVQVADSDRLTVSNSRVFGNAERGIYLDGGSDDATVSGNTVYGVPGYGATAQPYGIEVSGANASISGNTVFQSAQYGIYVANANAVVTGNVVHSGSYIGIAVSGSQAQGNLVAVSGNTVHGNQTGISASWLVLVSGNTVYNNYTAGLSVQAARVEDNVVYSNADGINTGYNGASVTGNRVFGNSRFGLSNTGGDTYFARNVVYSNGEGLHVDYYSGWAENNLIYANDKGIVLGSAGGARLTNNTVYQRTGDAVTVNSSPNIRLRNNILWAEAGYLLNVSSDSQPTFDSDYNGLRAVGGAKVARWNNADQATLAAWQNASGQDLHGLDADPLFGAIAGPNGTLGYSAAPESAAQIIDDGNSGFALTGDWQPRTTGGLGGDHLTATGATSETTASWTFVNLKPGVYEVAVTWPGFGQLGTPLYSVFDGDQRVSQRATGNQYYASGDFADAGVGWARLEAVHVTSGTLTVRLTAPSGGVLVADAARICRLAGDSGADDNFAVSATSPTIDQGDPQTHSLAEPAPNGGRANLGHTGNSADARPSPQQLLQVLSPNGGEKLIVGDSVPVVWRSSGLSTTRTVALIDSGSASGAGNWLSDAYAFVNGAQGFARPVDTSGVTDPAPQSVYQSYVYGSDRGGTFIAYRLPVPDGTYTLRLHFVDTSGSPGSRLMDVVVNGTVVRSRFDVYSAAGGNFKAVALAVPVTSTGGEGIDVRLVNRSTTSATPILSGVEVTAQQPGGSAAPAADVDVSSDGGATWTTVGTGQPMDRLGRGSFLWTAGPATAGNAALVRVRATSGSRAQDASDAPFLVSAGGRDYYVNDAATDGDTFTTAPGGDANSGKSPDRPMASLSALLDAYDLGPGDVVHVDAGTYRLLRNVVITSNDSGVRIEGPSTGEALFDRGNVSSNAFAFEVRGAAGVTLDRLSITGGYYGVLATGPSHDLTVARSRVFGNYEYGIYVYDVASERAAIIDNMVFGVGTGSAMQRHGISVAGNRATITGNTVHSSIGYGIFFYNTLGLIAGNTVFGGANIGIMAGGGQGQSDLVTVSGNTVYGNARGINASFRVLVTGNTAYGNFGAGIMSQAARVENNVAHSNQDGIVAVYNGGLVSGNRVYNNSRFGLQSYGGDTRLVGNVSYGNAQGLRLDLYSGVALNNLIYGNSVAGVFVWASSGAVLQNNTVYQRAGDAVVVQSVNTRLRNNILWAGAGSVLDVSSESLPTLDSDYNTLATAGAGKVAQLGGVSLNTLGLWQGTAQDAHSVGLDPAFVDPDGGDNQLGHAGGADRGADDNFHVRPTSPTIDQGDPLSYHLAEPAPSGGRANQGYDGNTGAAQVSPPQAVQVLSPNGGEKLTVGQPARIEWRGGGLNSTRVVAVIDVGGVGAGEWLADAYATTLDVRRFNASPVNTDGVTNPAPQSVYQSYSTGGYQNGTVLAYALPVPDGTYTIRLHFADPGAPVGARLADVLLNGGVVYSKFDIVAAAGGSLKATALSFTVTASGGNGIKLELVHQGVQNYETILSGIELSAADGGVAAAANDVDLSTDNGATWVTLATNQPTDRFGRGAFDWTPDAATAGNAALVRVRAASGSRPQDVSDAPFGVAPAGHDFYLNDASRDGDVFTTGVGDDANDGKSPARPMASLSLLLEKYDLGPGDVVHADAGTYRLLRNIIVTAADSGVRIEGPTDPAVVALFDRGAVFSGAYAFDVVGAADVALHRLSLTGGANGIVARAGAARLAVGNSRIFANAHGGLYADGTTDSLVIANNTFYGLPASADTNQDYGVWVEGSRSSITGNTAYNSDQGIYLGNATGVISGNTVYRTVKGIVAGGAQNPAQLVTVSGNTVRDNGTGISVTFGVLVVGNTAYNNNVAGIASHAAEIRDNVVYSNFDGIATSYNGGTAIGNRVYNNTRYGMYNIGGNNRFVGNKVYQNSIGIYGLYYSGYVLNNVVHSNTNTGILLEATNGARLINNTVYQPVGDAIAITGSANIGVRNNILWTLAGYDLRVAPGSGAGLDSDYNVLHRGAGASAGVGLWDGVARATLAEWQAASGKDLNSLSVAPRFVDTDGADGVLGYTNNGGGFDGGLDDNFQLSAGSPAIDRGDAAVAPATDIFNAPRADDPGTPNAGTGNGIADVGAYEFQGSTNDVTAPAPAGSTPAGVHSGGVVHPGSRLVIGFSEPVDPIDANAPANFELRGAGPDGALDTTDDILYTLSPRYAAGQTSIALELPGGPMGAGLHRLTVRGLTGRGVHDLAGLLIDGDGDGAAGGDYVRTFAVGAYASVAGRQVFYNNSVFDKRSAAANADDDAAIATDKQALLPGQAAAFRNYTSFDKGVNGIMIDVAGLLADLAASDFLFQVGTGAGDLAATGAWGVAAAPLSVTRRRGAGVNGSDRITITWADRAIRNQWLKVTVLATPNTGLAAADVFYFGNLCGETGNSPAGAEVTAVDQVMVRRHLNAGRAAAGVNSRYDFNRDGKVNTMDIALARRNASARPLRLITAPPAVVAGAAYATTTSRSSVGRVAITQSSVVGWSGVGAKDEPLNPSPPQPASRHLIGRLHQVREACKLVDASCGRRRR